MLVRAITPCILKEMHSFLNLEVVFDYVMWFALLLMFFFPMLRKSNVMPESIKSFDFRKQLVRKDIQILDNMFVVNMKWSKTRQFGHLVKFLSQPCPRVSSVLWQHTKICSISSSRSFSPFVLHVFCQ